MKKYIRTFIAFAVFIIFTAATLFVFLSDDYNRAKAELAYLNTDLGKLGVSIEETTNKMNGTDENSAYKSWQKKVEDVEKTIQKTETQGIIFGSFSVLALGASIIFFVVDNKKK